MAERLDDKVAVITGAASGIGEATVRRFVAEGARVVAADIQAAAGAALAAELGDAVRFVECDVTDEDAVSDALETAVSTWGRLDVVFNNAGVVGAVGSIDETPSDAWRRTIDILLNSVFYGCKHGVRLMRPNGSGSIINTTSVAGVIGGLGPHAYTAAKTAVVGLTKSVASEVMSSGLRCNAIAPGTIPTALTAAVSEGDPAAIEAVRQTQLERYGISGDVSDIVNAALYLASDEARLVNGHTLVVDAGRSVNGGSPRFAARQAGMVGIPGVD